MKRAFFWFTITSGAFAAYLMYRRGADWSAIADNAVRHPVKTLIHEVSEVVNDSAAKSQISALS